MTDEPTHKMVNGELVELSPEEIAVCKAEAAMPPIIIVEDTLLARLAKLEARVDMLERK